MIYERFRKYKTVAKIGIQIRSDICLQDVVKSLPPPILQASVNRSLHRLDNLLHIRHEKGNLKCLDLEMSRARSPSLINDP